MAHLSEDQLYAYIDRELAESSRRRVEAHLEACPACQERVSELTSLFADIESVPDEPLGRDLAPDVVAAVRARQRESDLLTRVAGAEALVAAAITAAVLLLRGGRPVPGTLFGGLSEAAVELQIAFELVAAEFYAAAVDLSSVWSELLAAVSQGSSGALPSAPAWLSWGPVLAVGLVLWLLGNGVLLRLGNDRSRG